MDPIESWKQYLRDGTLLLKTIYASRITGDLSFENELFISGARFVA